MTIMERPKPTGKMIEAVCGADRTLIESLHHGLNETPALRDFYPVLDFKELVAFAASSWKSRQKGDRGLIGAMRNGNLYDLFSEVFRIGTPWVNKHISDLVDSGNTYGKIYNELNPFNGKGLEERLKIISGDSKDRLFEQLAEEPSTYVFECDYQHEKELRGGDNHKLELMSFQNVYPNKEKIVPAYTAEIARILKEYPTAYLELVNGLIDDNAQD